jgi:hypothetical protein
MDEVYEARKIAKARGDKGPKDAIAEQAVAIGFRRKWDGEFTRFEKWDAWQKLKLEPKGIQIRTVHAMLADLELTEDDPADHVYVLVGSVEAPVFIFLGWALGSEVKHEKYWRPTLNRFVFPHASLRHCWQLRRQPRKSAGRLSPSDPADDFGGHGKYPHMLDSDTGRHPKYYGNIITSKWTLPCRRCQKPVLAGHPSGGNMRTGTIHGDPAECGFTIVDESVA